VLDAPDALGDGSITINLSTSNNLRSEFGMFAPMGSCVSRVTRGSETTYDIVIAGAGRVMGNVAESQGQEATCFAGSADIAGAGSHPQFGQWTRDKGVLTPAQIPV
jgi:hypothetical protein